MKGSHIQMIVLHDNRQSKYPVRYWNQLLIPALQQAFLLSPAADSFQEAGIQPLVSLTWAGPRLMRRMNREARQIDQITDVLSFPLLDFSHGQLPVPPQPSDFDLTYTSRRVLPLGDLVISLDRAFEQAAAYQHTNEREVVFLAVHGLLHLIGFDHQTRKEEKIMIGWQKAIMDSLGISRNHLTVDD